MQATEEMVHVHWKTLAERLLERLKEIEDTLRSNEMRHPDTGSDAKAALAKMSEADYKYIRRMAIVP